VKAHETLERLARAHYDRLFRAALFMCNSQDVAEDLVQETFLAAARSLEDFENRSSHYTWLYGILLNKFRGWLRRKGRAVEAQGLGPGLSPSDAAEQLADERPDASELMERHERAELVRAALDELPAHHRGVLVLRYLEHMSYEEVAEAMGCSVGTVKSRIHYALKKVGEKLKDRSDVLG